MDGKSLDSDTPAIRFYQMLTVAGYFAPTFAPSI
jgi:hypothetical protein